MNHPGTAGRRPHPALVALATLSMLVGATAAGCSTGGDDTARPGSSSTSVSAADVEFATTMRDLDRQGLRMSRLARTTAASPEVRRLARRTAAAQHRELRALSSLRHRWGAMHAGSMPMMPGSTRGSTRGSTGTGMRRGMMDDRHLDRLSRMHGPTGRTPRCVVSRP